MAGAGEKAVIARIHGRVQGVWYRAWTVENAVGRGLRGWVRNREDGSVEALFCGPAPAVDEMIEACRRGPRSARVERIDQASAEPVLEPGFHQLPTA
ncbi:MAG: acylphosphatase [Dongiaceae bacterium]